MAKDEREEEQEFLDGLKARTGRDLAQWMTAITAQGFVDKNQTIDWLRAQGLTFARASRLERIHSNGGKPIYADAPVRKVHDPERPASGNRPPPKPAQNALPAADATSLERLVSAAKGYRPLYHLLEAEVRKAVPDVGFTPKPGYVSIGAPGEFAAITLHTTEVRLGLDLGDRAFDPQVQRAKLKGPGPAMTHMVVLTDARQVNDELLFLIKRANDRVNS